MGNLNNDNKFDFDLEFGQIAEIELRDALVGKCSMEVKTERGRWRKTGNVFIEYESRGKKSGIAVTQARYFAICLADEETHLISQSFFVLDTNQFKTWLKKEIRSKTLISVSGGDNNTSKGYLVPINRLHEVFYV